MSVVGMKARVAWYQIITVKLKISVYESFKAGIFYVRNSCSTPQMPHLSNYYYTKQRPLLVYNALKSLFIHSEV